MSSTEALKAGLRGKALRITHYYRDLLWQVLLEILLLLLFIIKQHIFHN